MLGTYVHAHLRLIWKCSEDLAERACVMGARVHHCMETPFRQEGDPDHHIGYSHDRNEAILASIMRGIAMT